MRLFRLALIYLALCAPAYTQGGMMPGPGMPASAGGGSSMATPLITVSGSNIPSNSTASQATISGGSGGSLQWQAGLDNTFLGAPSAIAGTISNLVVNFPTVLSTGSYALTLNVNGSATALTCTITSASTSCTDATHNVSVAVGDILMWQSTPTGTPTVQAGVVQLSAVFNSTTPGESQLFICCTAPSTSTANYFPFEANQNSATEANVSGVMPTNGVISKLNVKTKGTVAANYVATLYVNGAATALTCSFSTGTTCTDTTNSVSVSAGDLISLQGCPGTTTGVGGSCTPSGSANTSTFKAAVRFVPTIAGEAVVFSPANGFAAGPQNNTTNFLSLTGIGGGGVTTETNTINISPIASTYKKLFVSQSPAPGSGTTRTITLRQGNGTQSSTSLTCTIATASTTCNDTSDTYSAPLNNFLDWQTTVSGTGAVLTAFRASAVVTIP